MLATDQAYPVKSLITVDANLPDAWTIKKVKKRPKMEQILNTLYVACRNVALRFRNCSRFAEEDFTIFVSEKRVGLQNAFLLIDAIEYITNLYRILDGVSVVMAQAISNRTSGKIRVFNLQLKLAVFA